jgi:serine protease Do
VQPLSDEQRKRLDISSGGVLIAQVNAGPAARAGIQSGDVVLKVAGRTVSDPEQFVSLVRELPRGKPVAFLIKREQGNLFVAVTLPKEAAEKRG